MKRAILFICSCILAAACSKTEPFTTVLATPEPSVRNVTASGFTLNWKMVENAESYLYSVNGDTTSTRSTSVLFSQLTPDTDYNITVRAIASRNGSFRSSGEAKVKVHTGDVARLSTPQARTICNYKSKTIIKWSAVEGAAGYEYSVGNLTGSTTSCEVLFSTLEASTNYNFKVKAVSPDQYSLDSDWCEVAFTTRDADEDIPPIIIDTKESGADYININVYALSNVSYYYDAVPTNYIETYGEDRIMELYKNYLVSSASQSSYGLGYFLSYGSMSYTITPVYPEMYYTVIVFGMDLNGNLTTGLITEEIKTTAADVNTEPSYKSSQDWFYHVLFLDTYKIYNPTNSIWAGWKGNNVKSIKTLLTSTESFKNYFDSDLYLLKEYTKESGTEFSPETVDQVNSENGFFNYYKVSSACSYTLASYALDSDGKEAFCVSTMATRASTTYYDWFDVSALGQPENGASNSLQGTLAIPYSSGSNVNLQLSGLKYLLKTTAESSGRTNKELIEMVDAEGTALTTSQLAKMNLSGTYTVNFTGLAASENYVLLAVARTNAGDETLRYRTAQTGEGDSTKAAGIEENFTAPHACKTLDIIIPFDVE